MGREILNSAAAAYNRGMLGTIVKVILLAFALVAATQADAQTRRTRHERTREPKEVVAPAPAVPADKRDRVVAAPGGFSGKPYWLALAQCGGIYFKLNILYTDIA